MTLRLVDADTHPGKDVFVDLRSGASGRVGGDPARVMAVRRPAPTCAAAHNLFKYSSRHPTHRPPGTVAMADFVASVRDFTRRFPGKELRLSEGWVTRSDALCCPTFEKTSFYRYVKARDRFIRYHTDLRRNKQH